MVIHAGDVKPPHQVRHLADETATLALGAALAERLESGTSIHLQGDLGAGKTTLTRGLLRGLGYAGRVKSPTFAWVEVYKLSKLYLYHFDFYRLTSKDAWAKAGFREYFNQDAACVVEWPEHAHGLPEPDLLISLQLDVPSGRRAALTAKTARGTNLLNRLS